MAFVCPECAAKTLKIASRLELGPDSRWDEITLQTVRCSRCKFEGVAVYQESRRGALDSEIVHHYGRRVGADDLKRSKRAIEACPDPGDPRCGCDAHRELNERDGGGRWIWLDGVRGEVFGMDL
jgi:hypothetical protein